MGMDKPLAVNFEVTVPRIMVLAKKPPREGFISPSTPDSEERQPEITEQVRLIALNKEENSAPHTANARTRIADAPARMLQHTVSFQRFHIADVSTGDGSLVCQILRRDASQDGDWRVTDELALTLDIRQVETSDNLEEAREEISFDARTHTVTIYADKDGIPVTYRIDGAES